MFVHLCNMYISYIRIDPKVLVGNVVGDDFYVKSGFAMFSRIEESWLFASVSGER